MPILPLPPVSLPLPHIAPPRQEKLATPMSDATHWRLQQLLVHIANCAGINMTAAWTLVHPLNKSDWTRYCAFHCRVFAIHCYSRNPAALHHFKLKLASRIDFIMLYWIDAQSTRAAKGVSSVCVQSIARLSDSTRPISGPDNLDEAYDCITPTN